MPNHQKITKCASLCVTAFLTQNPADIAEALTDCILENLDCYPEDVLLVVFLGALESADLWEGWTYDPPAHVAYHLLPALLRAFGVEDNYAAAEAGIKAITARCGQPLPIDEEG